MLCYRHLLYRTTFMPVSKSHPLQSATENSGGRDPSNYFCMLRFIYILFTIMSFYSIFPISDDKSGDELLFVQRCNHVAYGGPTLGDHWSAMSCLLGNYPLVTNGYLINRLLLSGETIQANTRR